MNFVGVRQSQEEGALGESGDSGGSFRWSVLRWREVLVDWWIGVDVDRLGIGVMTKGGYL